MLSLTGWVTDNVVAPHEMTLHPTSFQPKQGLTDADYARALQAVGLARAISDPDGSTKAV